MPFKNFISVTWFIQVYYFGICNFLTREKKTNLFDSLSSNLTCQHTIWNLLLSVQGSPYVQHMWMSKSWIITMRRTQTNMFCLFMILSSSSLHLKLKYIYLYKYCNNPQIDICLPIVTNINIHTPQGIHCIEALLPPRLGLELMTYGTHSPSSERPPR